MKIDTLLKRKHTADCTRVRPTRATQSIVFVTPMIRAKLNHQFMLGARNQAFMTEYVSGMETVKSLQMEPQLKNTFSSRRAYPLAVRRMKTMSPITNT